MPLAGETPEFEWLHLTGSGEEITCVVRLVQLPWSGQKILCGIVEDVTRRKRNAAIESSRNHVLEKLARGGSLEEVLTLLVEKIQTQFSGMLCSVLLLDHATNCLHHGAAPHLPDFYNRAVEGIEIGPKIGSCGAAAYLGERVVVSDVHDHENWAPYIELADKANIRACWSRANYFLKE